MPAAPALRDSHYGRVVRRTVRQRLWVLGCHVFQGASGVQACRQVRGAVESWGAALGPGSTLRDVARIYQEQVLRHAIWVIIVEQRKLHPS